MGDTSEGMEVENRAKVCTNISVWNIMPSDPEYSCNLGQKEDPH